MTERRRREPGEALLPYPRFQAQTADWLELQGRRHAVHSLFEVDVTAARAAIREARARTGEPLSLTGYLVGCLAAAVDADKRIAALRHGRRRLLVFDAVDVALPVESGVEGEAIPVPHVIREANRKSLAAISREIRDAAADPVPYAGSRRYLGAWLWLPAWLRRQILALLLSDARRRKHLTGTVLLTTLAMPGTARAWGIPNGTAYPVTLLVGALFRDSDGREHLSLTLTFDHDTVNGAPAARFARRFVRLVEGADLVPGG